MRLATIRTDRGTRVAGVTDDSRFIDLNQVDENLPTCLRALLADEHGIARAAAAFKQGESQQAFAEGTLIAPIPKPGKVLCIGLNYRDHAAETGADVPSQPICFSKFTSAIIGPEETIVLPKVAEKVDFEAELVVVLGRRGKNIPRENARAYIAGYMNGNDVSARDWQIGRPGGQWLLGKTPDTFAPTGPYLLTADEIADPHQLNVMLRLNGDVMQNSNTRELIFGVDELIAHISQLITLEPGDLIFTGTPPGVGVARKPPVFLKPGDKVEVEIERLGILRNPVAAE